MRAFLAASAALFALGAASAFAAPVTVAPLALGAEAQKEFKDNYGLREVDYLNAYLQNRLAIELADAQGAPLRLEVTLIGAKPNRPTMQQMGDKPGLDFGLSKGIGGAELQGKFIDAQGNVVREIGYRWYESSITNVVGAGTWTDARRAIRRFADEVSEAYAPDTDDLGS